MDLVFQVDQDVKVALESQEMQDKLAWMEPKERKDQVDPKGASVTEGHLVLMEFL